MKITRRGHFIVSSSRHKPMDAILSAHRVRGVSRLRRHTDGEPSTQPSFVEIKGSNHTAKHSQSRWSFSFNL